MSDLPERDVTPIIERANRLLSLRSNPGYQDVLQMSKEIVDMLTATTIEYPGWDLQQLMTLKARAQAAKEHHEILFAKIADAIHEGIQAQAALNNTAEKPISDIVDHGDYVRQQVLTKFEEFDSEGRLPGSY
jgi:hypothetical protein